MQRQTRVSLVAVIGLLASALVPAVILSALTPLTGHVTEKSLGTLLTMAVVFYPFVAIFAVALGLPAFFLFRWLGILNWWSTLLAGFVIGIAALTIVSHQIVQGRYLLLYGGIGAAAAAVFWVVWALAGGDSRGNVPNDA
jgi:hypothetical protein